MSNTMLTKILHAMVKDAPSNIPAKTIAELLHKPYATLMLELGNDKQHKLDADLVIPIIKLTESDAAINHIARELGGVFVPVPDPADSPACLVTTLADSIKEFGEFAAETAQSLSDGIISKQELIRIEKEGYEAIVAIVAMMKLAKVTHNAQQD